MDLSQFDHLFKDFPTTCPYGLPHWAIYRQVAVRKIDQKIYEALILSGCRRGGNLIYRMACLECRECVPIKMEAQSVKLNKTQRKVRNKNQDLKVTISKPEFTVEKLEIYKKFLKLRYPNHKSPERLDYEDFFVDTCVDTREVCYSLEEKIVGIATVDIGKNLLNGVYFFFDPDFEKRSPGVYNFIFLNEYCKEKGIPYFATGYYIKDLPSMAYKATFFPHELFIDGEWRRVEKYEDTKKQKTF